MLLHLNPFQTLSFRFTSQEPVCIKDFSVTWEGGEGMGGVAPLQICRIKIQISTIFPQVIQSGCALKEEPLKCDILSMLPRTG